MEITSLGSQVTLAALPFIVYGVTHVIKKAQAIKYSDNSRSIIRTIAAVLAFGGVVAGSVATGTPVEDGAVQDFVMILLQAGLVFFGATGLHEVAPSNNPR
jgi:hypothetical protein